MHAKETVYIPVVVAVCLLAVGCSSTSEFVCTSDWLETGSRDGQNGVAGNRIERYVRDCAAFDVVPEQEVYERGRQEGLQVYCTQENGYALAVDSGRLQDVCPSELATAFRDGFRDGELMLLARQAIDNLNDDKRSIENDMRCAAQEIDGGTTELGILSIESESNASVQARQEIERLTGEFNRLELDIDTAEGQCSELVSKHQALDYRIEVSYCQATASRSPSRFRLPGLENACVTSGSSGSDDSE